jgi:hypothetical protein
MGFDQLLAPYGADAFAGLGFDSNLVRVQAQDSGEAVADGVVIIGEFGSFGVDDAVEIYDMVSGLVDAGSSGTQHIGRVAATIRGFRVREQSANIGQCGSTEDRVDHGVEQHIGVAVADELPVVRYIDAPQPQRAAGRSPV